MIFCVITGTPCIVIDNSNHKISGVYHQWLKDIPYVTYINNYLNEGKIINKVIEIIEKKFQPISFELLHSQFEPLVKACK